MATDFFQQQHDARRASGVLLLLFVLALALLIGLLNLGVFACWFALRTLFGDYNAPPTFVGYWLSPTCWAASVAGLLLFASGSVDRFVQLRKSSTALADLVGAEEVTDTTRSRPEKRLINVVEELAVASGSAVPRVFVMQTEPAINAFVAGRAPDQILVVTRGLLEHLSRAEMQGVIGHEFSHLLNGDSELNLRMLCLLAGFSSISRRGAAMMETLGPTPYWPHSSGDNKPQWWAADGMAGPGYGSVLCVAGYAGLFMARLIKAAVSRQRERLADATAWQFTRSPEGLANALIRIRNGPGSLLHSPHAEDLNHLCFGDSLAMRFRALLATHPHIDARLRQIGPSWVARANARLHQQQAGDEIGSPEEAAAERQDVAASHVARIPDTLLDRLHAPAGAALVMYALLTRVEQQSRLPAITQEERLMFPILVQQVAELGERYRVLLVDLALPALKRLDDAGRQRLLANIDWLIKADGQISLFEYLLRELVRRRLQPTRRPPRQRLHRRETAAQMQLVLSMLARTAGADEGQQEQLFHEHARAVLPAGRGLLPLEQCALQSLVRALHDLRGLTPLWKKALLQAGVGIVTADQQVSAGERELLRLICLLMDSPVPAVLVPDGSEPQPALV